MKRSYRNLIRDLYPGSRKLRQVLTNDSLTSLPVHVERLEERDDEIVRYQALSRAWWTRD
jgi:hypothetical protein